MQLGLMILTTVCLSPPTYKPGAHLLNLKVVDFVRYELPRLCRLRERDPAGLKMLPEGPRKQEYTKMRPRRRQKAML
jgi:hypothetical protein